jgi:hypothetical protein
LLLDEIWDTIALPKLESLTITHDTSYSLAIHLLRTTKKLKKLVFLPEVLLRREFCVEIIDIFKSDNNEIKQLELGKHMSQYLFFSDISQHLKLKLTSLKIKQFHHYFETNVENFLLTQSKSLEHLDFDFVTASVLKIIIEKMVALKSLKLETFYLPLLRSFNDYKHQNPLIVDLNLCAFSIPIIKLLLKIMPNVKVLRLMWATDKELKKIIMSGKNLEKIYFNEIEYVKA